MDNNKNSFSSENKQFSENKLYVANLPAELDKDKIKIIFSDFGEVIKVFSPRNKNFAYVTYSKYEEAEEAIKQLHDKPPLFLKVDFSGEKCKLPEMPDIDLSAPIPDFRYQKSEIALPVENQKSIDLGMPEGLVSFSTDEFSTAYNLLYPVTISPFIFNPYEKLKENKNDFYESNVIHTRKLVSSKRDSRRHVSAGRGYTNYNLTEPRLEMAGFARNDIFEYGVDILEDENGNCETCTKFTSYKCQKCKNTFYCSKQCQIDDWPMHKTKCELLPFLVKLRKDNSRALNSDHLNKNIANRLSNLTMEVKSLKQTIPLSAKNDEINLLIEQKIMQLPSVLDDCKFSKIGSKGVIMVHSQLSNNIFTISMIPESKIKDFQNFVENFSSDCENSNFENRQFEIADFVCCLANPEEYWLRGFVVKKNPVLEIALIDECRVMINPCRTIKMLDSYAKICSYGLIMTFESGDQKIEDFTDNTFFEVLEIRADSIMLKVTVEGKFISNAVVKKWKPFPEQIGVTNFDLKSGMEVVINHFVDQNSLFIASIEPNDRERNILLQQNITKYVRCGEKFLKTPVIGEMVAAPFLDGNYYRAVVIKVDKLRALVKYVDFGNEYICFLKNLYILPNYLKEEPSCIKKVSLKDVPTDDPLTEEAAQYLQSLIIESIPLTCTFDGKAENGVVLKTVNGENVNQNLIHYLKPYYERFNPDEERECLMFHYLPNLPLGKEGETKEVLLLSTISSGKGYFMCPIDKDAIVHIHEKMPKLISKYVDKTKNIYIPRDHELCIAKYKTKYYRGLCLVSSYTPKESQILFVDYGNIEIVKHENIRLMVKDFLMPERLTSTCVIDFIPDDKLTDKVFMQKFESYMKIHEKITIKINKVFEDDGAYEISLPEIQNELVKEGLLCDSK